MYLLCDVFSFIFVFILYQHLVAFQLSHQLTVAVTQKNIPYQFQLITFFPCFPNENRFMLFFFLCDSGPAI